MKYEGTAKHKEPWQRGRRGTICPKTIDLELAAKLLAVSELVQDKRFAVHHGQAFCAQRHGDDVWHGYPVGWVEVPESLRRQWRSDGRVRRRDIRENWD